MYDNNEIYELLVNYNIDPRFKDEYIDCIAIVSKQVEFDGPIVITTNKDQLSDISNLVQLISIKHDVEFTFDRSTKWLKSYCGNCKVNILDQQDIWVFTDGGAKANGKPNCIASWGFAVGTNKSDLVSDSGIVPPVNIIGKKYKSSNNRGELTAILKALIYVNAHYKDTNITLVSDSQYGIKSVDTWIHGWLKSPDDLSERLNIDLILPIKKLIDDIRETNNLVFIHVYSHKKEPTNQREVFIWEGNKHVDELCTSQLLSVDQ
jgi:ribonuclease HI